MSATHTPHVPIPSLGTIIQLSWQQFLQWGSRLVAIAVLGGVTTFLIEYLFDPSTALTTLRDGTVLTFDGQDRPALLGARIAITCAAFVIDTITLRAMLLHLRTPAMSTRMLIRRTAGRFMPFFILNALVTAIITLGLLAFIIPGIVLLLTFVLAPVVLVWEDRGILDALRRSAAMTHGVRLRILAVGLVASLLIGSIGLLVGGIPYLASFTQMALMVPFLTVVTATLYTIRARPHPA